MAAYRQNDVYDTRMRMNFHSMDDMQPQPQPPRISSSGLRLYDQEYQHQDAGNPVIRQTPKKRCGCCTKRCVIGLLIGLFIGALAVVAVAVPIGVTNWYKLGTISSTPNWVGTYQADNACDATRCCCFSGSVTVTKPSANQLQIAGTENGQCIDASPTVTQTASITTGFQTTFVFSQQTIRLQLAQDSSYISYVNINYALCSGSALRTSYNAGNVKSMNLGLIMFIVLFTVGIMI